MRIQPHRTWRDPSGSPWEPLVAVAILVSSFSYLEGQQPRPAWAADQALSEPRLFAEGSISTPADEMDAAFTADGKTLYFTRNHMGQRLGVILETHFANGRWSEPQVAAFSGRFTDYDPFIAPDGSKLFFASNRPVSGAAKKDFDVWVVERTARGWSEPKNVGEPINTPQDEFYPAAAADGTLYFSATRRDTKGRSDIYKARWRQTQYDIPENLGDAINSPAVEVDSYVSPDQTMIIFAGIGRPDDLGGGDLYISRQVNGAWMPAKHLEANINSPTREYLSRGIAGRKYFFFTSFRGFGDRVPDKPWTYAEYQGGLKSVLNGWGNIYQIDMSALK